MVEERRLEVDPDATEAVQPTTVRASSVRPPFRDRASVGRRRQAESRGRKEQSRRPEAICQRIVVKIFHFEASLNICKLSCSFKSFEPSTWLSVSEVY